MVKNARGAEITAEQTAIQVNGSNAYIHNAGQIAGGFNGVNFANGGVSSGVLVNGRSGVISSDSRAVNIDGSGVDLFNFGRIVGTGDQRNGTIYSDATADDYSIVNGHRAVVDAGAGNQGAGIALQTGEVDGDTVFPELRWDDWRLVDEETAEPRDDDEFACRFARFVRAGHG